MATSDIHAVQLRQERMDGEIKLLASTMAQNSTVTAQAMQSMQHDIRQMTQDVRGMAPHAQDIGRLYKLMEGNQAAILALSDRQAAMKQTQARWSGGLAVIMVLGGVLWGLVNQNVRSDISAVATAVTTIGQTHTAEIGKLERRIERLEGMN